jgi:hypothetical protein
MKKFGLLIVACVGLAGCPVASDHPIVGTWRVSYDLYSDGEFLASYTEHLQFTAFGNWSFSSLDGTVTYVGVWRETSTSSVIADVSDQRTLEGMVIRQDYFYELTVDGDSLSGSGTVNACFDLECTVGSVDVRGVLIQ